MGRFLLLAALLMTLSGCGYINRHIAFWTDYSLICVEETHVMYVQFSSGAAPLVDQDGKPQSCK
jgi:hypothetical protein